MSSTLKPDVHCAFAAPCYPTSNLQHSTSPASNRMACMTSEDTNTSGDQNVLSVSLLSKQKMKEAELKLNTSYGEADSVLSTSTFISDSFYSNNGVTDPAAYDFPSRAATKVRCYEKFSDLELSSFTDTSCLSTPPQLRMKMQPQAQNNEVCLRSKPKPSQKREVDWGDRSSIRLSVDYTKQLSKASSPTNSDKGDANYFKICFATEFSDDDEDVQGAGIEPAEIDEDVKSALPETSHKLDQSFTVRCSQPYAMTCHAEVLTERAEYRQKQICEFQEAVQKKKMRSVNDVNLLTAKTKKLLGPLPTSNGFFLQEVLEKLLFSQLQLILNDLLCQISELNDELMRELPLRDDLQIENEERKAHLQQLLLSLRSRKLTYALDCKLVRPTTLLPLCQPISADYHSADSFNPQSPREKPQQLSPGPTPTSPRIAKLKSYFFGFFNKKRSKDTSPTERSSI